jgi:hypothetical protein
MTLQVVEILYRRFCTANELEIEGRGPGLILALISAFTWRNWEEPWEISIRIVGLWAAFRTRDLRNSMQDSTETFGARIIATGRNYTSRAAINMICRWMDSQGFNRKFTYSQFFFSEVQYGSGNNLDFRPVGISCSFWRVKAVRAWNWEMNLVVISRMHGTASQWFQETRRVSFMACGHGIAVAESEVSWQY